jgi:archaellum component FlaC
MPKINHSPPAHATRASVAAPVSADDARGQSGRAPGQQATHVCLRHELTTPEINPQQSSSEYDPQNLSDDQSTSYSNVSRRPKRKRTSTSEMQLTNFMTEMKEMFSDFKKQQEAKMDRLHSVIDEIKTRASEISSSIEFLSNKYDSLMEQMNDLKKENSRQQEYIHILDLKIENLERGMRSTCLEISNIPTTKPETKDMLIATITDIGKIVNSNIQAGHIKDIFRINTRNPDNRTIIVDLVSVIAKDSLLKAYKQFNKGTSKLHTEHLKISGPSKPIYICENLTAKMKRLFYLTRVFANSNTYKYCWTTNGKIFIREKDGSPPHMIKDESDLRKLRKPE